MDFKNVDKKYRPIPFWSWNEKLDPTETRRQVGLMDEAGVGGYFMHARGGLLTEYMSDEWFDNIDAACDEGNARGMYPWAYDENGWPSGFGDRKVSGLGVDYQQKILHCEKLTDENRDSENTVAVKNGYRYYFEVNEFYVDVLDPNVIRRFIDEIYEKYKERTGNKCAGFFTDEPQILRGDGYPWSFYMQGAFREKYGYALVDRINELFFDEGDYVQTRVDFWALATELFRDSFFKQIYEWCVENGYGLTGHLVCDDSLVAGLNGSGALLPHYEYFTIPGMDWLGVSVGTNYITPLAVGSAAAQFGKKQVLSETFAGAGHNVSHQQLKRIYEWQMVRGINLLCTHLEGYSNRGIRKRDYPPALYYQQPWWDDMKIFFDTVSRIGMILAEGEQTPDTLVYMAASSVWSEYNGYNGPEARDRSGLENLRRFDRALMETIHELERKHILFHLGDETVMGTHGRVEGGKLIIGKMSYSRVVIPYHVYMMPAAKALFDEFRAAGGIITTAEEIEPNPITEVNNLSYTKRTYPDYDVHYFVNLGDETVSATFSRGNLILNAETGETAPFYGSHTFAPGESILLIDNGGERERMPAARSTSELSLLGNWRVKEASYNSITLDKCDYSFDGELIATDANVLDIIHRINEKRRPVRLNHKYKFTVRKLPDVLYLGTETPEIFDITLNGSKVEKRDLGHFRDISFRLIDIRDLVVEGENEIVFESTLAQSEKTYEHIENSFAFESMRNSLSLDIEVEPIYLVGNFGAKIIGDIRDEDKGLYRIEREPVVAEMPTVVDIEHLDESGYPEFAGTLVLEKEFDIDDVNKHVILRGRGLNSIHISVNGREVATKMFAPYTVDLSEHLTLGKNTIELKILNNLRNMMGPHHLKFGDSTFTGRNIFYREKNVFFHGVTESDHSVIDEWYDEGGIHLARFGITK